MFLAREVALIRLLLSLRRITAAPLLLMQTSRTPPLDSCSITETPTALSKDLKRRGWSFVGPTTVYAFMQAMGLVNDHLEGCWVRDQAEASRRAAAQSIGIEV